MLVTADQNLPYQQSLPKYAIGVVVLAAASNRIEAFEPLSVGLNEALRAVSQGEVVRVTA